MSEYLVHAKETIEKWYVVDAVSEEDAREHVIEIHDSLHDGTPEKYDLQVSAILRVKCPHCGEFSSIDGSNNDYRICDGCNASFKESDGEVS